MSKFILVVLSLMAFNNLIAINSSHAVFGFFKKKPKPVVQEKLSKDDKIGYVDRTNKDLSQLKSIKVFVEDGIDVNSSYKIKSVLQDNELIYKVIPTDFKNYIVYFDEGQPVNSELVTTLITAAGFKPQIKP